MSQPATSRSTFLLPAVSLAAREVVRFLRQPSRVVGAVATPVVFWVLLGGGLGRSFRLPGVEVEQHYMAYVFTGAIALIVLFTAIFATISIIEDRKEGFLQSVLVSPVRRAAIAVGKIGGATALSLLHAIVFLLLAPTVGISFSAGTLAATLGVIILVSLGSAGLGFLIAWWMNSSQGYHALMNLLLMPMWLLSGSMFPAAGATTWIRWAMAINPMTYGVAALRHAMEPQVVQGLTGVPSFGVSLGITAGFALATLALSAVLVGLPDRG